MGVGLHNFFNSGASKLYSIERIALEEDTIGLVVSGTWDARHMGALGEIAKTIGVLGTDNSEKVASIEQTIEGQSYQPGAVGRHCARSVHFHHGHVALISGECEGGVAQREERCL